MGRQRRVALAALAVAALGTAGVGVANAGPAAPTAAGQQTQRLVRQQAFAAAAHAFGVPERVLLAVSYNESLWEQHAGAPSTSSTYGAMSLTDVPASAVPAKGAGAVSPRTGSVHALDAAARLAHVSPAAARTDGTANIRAGAALLASYARGLDHGRLPTRAADWYGAVARYAGTSSKPAAEGFADDVYTTIRTGAARRTDDGQQVALAADPSVRPNAATAAPLHLIAPAGSTAECPPTLGCDVVPAAYHLNNPTDISDYGDYDLADRPHAFTINHIVLHDTEELYADTLNTFTDPTSYVSAHYVIRSADGHVTQLVPTKDVAWQAGNWYVNMHSVGIEQEGYAVQGATWFTESLYHSSASLVRYLAARFHIPLDRQHIIGHDNVPGLKPTTVAGMHWDPGPFWDWGHYLTLLRNPIRPTATRHSPVVTINPRFSTNVQQVTDCETNDPVPAQASSFVWLRTAPSTSAPLVSDPALHPDGTAGTTCAADWGDKASVGQQFVVAGRHRSWTAIWWDGQKVWFADPNGRATTPSRAFVVRPRAGRSSVPVYGGAYPEASAYPAGITPQTVTPLQYTIKAGQRYATTGPAPTDYYSAPTYATSASAHTEVVGHDRYLQVQLGHRIAFVRASDVTVSLAIG